MSEVRIEIIVPSDITQPPKTTKTRPRLRPNYPRARTGCLTCRRRKKKCDEKKPICSGCSRNKIPCQWPEKKADAQPPSTAPPITTSSDSPDQNQPAEARLGIVRVSRSDRACTLTPQSSLLLSHYLCETGMVLGTQPIQRNSFITHIAPLAYADDLLMHSVLALSGTHLAYRKGSDSCVQTATLQHYSTAISGLRTSFTTFKSGNVQETVKLLLVLLVVCHYEILSGERTGVVFNHLRACRSLIVSIFPTLNSSFIDTLPDQEKTALSVCLELYAYIMTTNTLTSYGTITNGGLPYDDFLFSLDSLSGYSSFGTMFGGCHSLFELIPQIAQFASARMDEEKVGLEHMSPKLQELHDKLETSIRLWTLPKLKPPCTETAEEWIERTVAAEVLRDGLFIYLASTSSGSVVSDKALLDRIQFHIDVMSHNLRRLTLPRVCANLMWPIIIAGSCVVKEAQRTLISRALKHSYFPMKHTFTACELLEKLWENPAPEAFGPYGLHLIEKTGFWLPVI